MKPKKFDAIVACGGLGTRLKAVTNDIPKPLFLVNGKSTLERCIKELDTYLLSNLLDNFDKNTDVYDTIIEKNLSKDWKIGRLGKNELNILRLSIFELKFFKKFDKKTIINEYVSLFNNFCGEPDFANGFLNNVLKSE